MRRIASSARSPRPTRRFSCGGRRRHRAQGSPRRTRFRTCVKQREPCATASLVGLCRPCGCGWFQDVERRQLSNDLHRLKADGDDPGGPGRAACAPRMISWRALTRHFHQPRRLGIIPIIRDRSVFDALDRLVDYEKRNNEPFARNDRIAEAVLDLDVEPRWIKDAMDEIFQPRSADVVKLDRSRRSRRRP